MATKKITELPLIQTISGSFSVVPIVIGNTAGNGTTDQITIENFSRFVTQYSAHTGSAGNIFTGPQIINSNVTINGRLTVTEVVAQYETASILFSTGSTKLGDELTDKHEFTGSTNITGSLIYNNVLVTNIDANTIHRLQQATASIELASASFNYFYQSTASLQQFTSSQDARNFIISQFTSSTDAHIVGISNFTSSNFDTMARVYQTSASINIFTGSQDSRNYVISQFTSSTDAHIVGISTYTSSQYDTMARVYQTTSSLQSTTASLNQFTASQDSRNFVVSQVTGSLIGITNGLMAFTAALDSTYATDAQLYQLYQATQSLELHSGSMVGITNGLMAYTASNSTLNTGLRGEVDGIEAYTASLKAQAIVSSSTQVQNYDVFALNSNLYTSTGSLIGITNGLMAFTASLDNTFATDAQLYQLYQSTRSIELTTGSLIGITNGLMAFTAALDNTYATDAQLLPILQATQSLELFSGSLIGITNGLMAFTAALDSTYATDAQLYQLYAETASIKAEIAGIELYTASLKAAAIVSSSTQVQNYDVFALNSNLYNSTGSIKGEIAGIEAYTASLKGAAIVSSSQQITNYYKFAETASANTTFYGNVTASGNLHANQLYIGGATTSTGLIGASEAVVQNELGIQFGDATGTYMRMIANGANSNTAIVAGAFSGVEPPLDLIVGGNTQMRLRADGNNGINTTTPVSTDLTGSLTIRKSYNNDIASVPTTTAQSYYSNQSGLYLFGRNSGISIIGSNSEEATICYGNASTHRFASISVGTGTDAVGGDLYIKVGSDTERLRVGATTGNLTVSTGNVIMGTAGKGIDFSATSNGSVTMTSELLNDYEEGTWTPVISDGTNDATMTATYNRGQYVKVGRQVTLTAYVLTDSLGSVTGNIRITGIPFTNGSGYGYIAAGVVGNAGTLNITAGHNITTTISTGTNYLTLNVWDDVTGATPMQASEWSADGQIQMTITYLTDY